MKHHAPCRLCKKQAHKPRNLVLFPATLVLFPATLPTQKFHAGICQHCPKLTPIPSETSRKRQGCHRQHFACNNPRHLQARSQHRCWSESCSCMLMYWPGRNLPHAYFSNQSCGSKFMFGVLSFSAWTLTCDNPNVRPHSKQVLNAQCSFRSSTCRVRIQKPPTKRDLIETYLELLFILLSSIPPIIVKFSMLSRSWSQPRLDLGRRRTAASSLPESRGYAAGLSQPTS